MQEEKEQEKMVEKGKKKEEKVARENKLCAIYRTFYSKSLPSNKKVR